MRDILPFVFIFLVLGFFLYIKLVPFKDKLDAKHLRVFIFFDRLFQPILNFLKHYLKPYKVGNGIALDLGQVVIMLVLLLFIVTL